MPDVQAVIDGFIERGRLPIAGLTDTVATATATMKRMRSECVVVMDDERIVGIFTERDFLNRVAAPGLDPATLPVREVMTRDPQTLTPDDRISYAINGMAIGGYRSVPIVDDEGRPIAVLNVRDVLRHLNELLTEAISSRPAAPGSMADDWIDVGGG